MNCLKCNFARKFPGDCKYVVCERFGGFRRVDGKCPKFRTNSYKLKRLGDYELARFLRELACPPDAKGCEADSCADCWKKWLESPADMEFWQNFEEEKANEDD